MSKCENELSIFCSFFQSMNKVSFTYCILGLHYVCTNRSFELKSLNTKCKLFDTLQFFTIRIDE